MFRLGRPQAVPESGTSGMSLTNHLTLSKSLHLPRPRVVSMISTPAQISPSSSRNTPFFFFYLRGAEIQEWVLKNLFRGMT